jgi:hypothetical protein
VPPPAARKPTASATPSFSDRAGAGALADTVKPEAGTDDAWEARWARWAADPRAAHRMSDVVHVQFLHLEQYEHLPLGGRQPRQRLVEKAQFLSVDRVVLGWQGWVCNSLPPVSWWAERECTAAAELPFRAAELPFRQ